MRRKRIVSRFIINILFIAGSIIMLVPFFLALVNSVKTAPEAQKLSLSLPTSLHFENYLTVIVEGKLIRGAINGLIYSVVSVAIVLLICSFTAFIIARRNDGISNLLNLYFMAGLIVPGSLITTFLILKLLGLLGTYQGLILMYTTGGIPMAIFLYRGFVSSIPRELDEAAFVDGAGTVRTFFTIIFPTLKPITSTVLVLTFMNIWNDFVTQLYFGTQELRGMPLSVYNFYGKYSQSWNLVFADVVLTMLPVLIVYVFAQKYIISGMTQGAVKG